MTLPPSRERRLWLFIDELPALQKLPSLGLGLAEMRKYGGCVVAGMQSIAQLGGLYGRENASSMLNLFNTYVFLRNQDPETTEWISRVLGEAEILETMQNLSYGANTMRDGVNLTNHIRQKSLVLPSEITALKNLEAYIKYPGDYPIFKMTFPYQNLPQKAADFVHENA